MTLDKLEEEVWQSLQELGYHAKIIRICMRERKNVCCGLKGYNLFFSAMYWVFNNFLVIRICRMTDEKNKQGVTMGRWLNKGLKQKPNGLDVTKLTAVIDEYNVLRESIQYQNIKTYRDKSYAHYDEDREKAEKLASTTWKDVFEIIEKLENIYNTAAAAGLCTPTKWAMEMPDIGTAKLLHIIEQSCHHEKKHQQIIAEN